MKPIEWLLFMLMALGVALAFIGAWLVFSWLLVGALS
jgi:hypothetical protein